MACSSPKKPPVQSTLRGFFSGNSTSTLDPEEDEVLAVGKMVKTPPSSRRPKKRRRSTPTLPEDLDEPRGGETLNNNDTPRRKSLRTKNEKIKLQRSPSPIAELDDSDFESEADLKKSKGKRKNGKTEKKLKKSNTKLPSPKLIPETDKKKFKGKFSTPPSGNVRSIMSYFAKSTTPAAVDPIICIGDQSSTVVDVDVDVVIMRTPVKSRGRSLETVDPELLHISPAKSELSVSSFEFEKEERRPSILISDRDSDSEVEVETSCKASNAVVEVEVVSSEENEDEENAEIEITVIRSDRKRIKLNSPVQTKSSKNRGSVKTTKAKKRTKSTLENVESQDSGITQSESLSGSGNSTPSSSQPQVEGGRRRSSRIQQIQIEKMEHASKTEIEPSSPPPASKKSRRRKKSRAASSISSSEDSVTIEHEDTVVRLSSSSEFSSDEDDDNFVRSKKKKKGTVKMASIFLSKKEREKEMQRLKEEKEPKKIISQATLDFLRSGVPEEIVKAQKTIVKRKTELDLNEPMQLFPTFSHNIELGEAVTVTIDFTQSAFPIKNIPNEDSDVILLPKLQSYFPKMQKLESSFHSKQFCCGEAAELPEDFLAIMEKIPRSNSESDSLPWVDKYRVQRRKDLVIDKKAHQKFETWLKQWRSDIKDDGGVSRKVVEKRKKKRESDSDFVTDEEAEEEYMKKSVVLVGPTGCGKTAMVYVLTKQIGFKIVEVSFSSRRSGKDVIQSVEEATLSRRISDNAEVDDDHCLLLFKDIDQLHPEEDEGFHAAVAQLITASCRPIVMTTSQPDFSVIDPKIHKKDPLWIYFNPPTPTSIVQNVLLPVIESELEHQKRSYDLDSNENDKRIVTTVLESLVRHSKCDIRKSLNQSQILWSTRNFFSLKTVHLNMYPLLDLELIASSSQKQPEIDFDLPVQQKKTKAERCLDIQAMEDLAKNFQLLTDVDIASSSLKSCVSDTDHCSSSQTIMPYFETGFQSALSEMWSRNEPLFHAYRSLILETDQHNAKKARITELYDELSSYVDQYDNYDAIAYVRTIVKASVVRSIGIDMKRNGRIKPYFNRLGRDAIDRMCNNFDFQQELAELKLAFGSETRLRGRNPH